MPALFSVWPQHSPPEEEGVGVHMPALFSVWPLTSPPETVRYPLSFTEMDRTFGHIDQYICPSAYLSAIVVVATVNQSISSELQSGPMKCCLELLHLKRKTKFAKGLCTEKKPLASFRYQSASFSSGAFTVIRRVN